jgi:hypothetical protein
MSVAATETADKKPISEALRDAIRAVFNEYPMGDHGAALLGDYILISEVHTGRASMLRIIEADEMLPWKRTGLLQWSLNDDIAESAAGYAWSMSHSSNDDDLDESA